VLEIVDVSLFSFGFRLFNFWKLGKQRKFLTMLWLHILFRKMGTIQKLENLVKFLISLW